MKNEIIDSDLSNIVSTSFSPIKIQNSKYGKNTSINLCQFITKSGFSFIAESKKQAIKIDNQTCQLICFSDLSEIVSDSSIKNESEGLILLTNNGETSRKLELPSTGWLRRYKVRVHGYVNSNELEKLKKGIKLSTGICT